MILVDVIIAERVDELADFQVARMRDHVCQQSVGTDVEGNSEKRIRRTLVQLAMQNFPRLDLELKERVTRWKINRFADARVPI